MVGGPTHDDLRLVLRVLSAEHVVEARARVGPTRLLEVLPLARAVADAVTGIALTHAAGQGKASSCRPGCGACCRQAVPVSPLEALRLADVVEAMPAERRREVEARFAAALARLEAAGLLDPATSAGRDRLRSGEPRRREAWHEASRRYFAVGVPCPFLVDESCSIYPERPTVCREYHVTSPPARCATLGPGIEPAPWPIRMGEVLVRLSNEALGRDDYALPLVLALEWARHNRAAFDVERDGAGLAGALVRHMQAQDDEVSAEPPAG